MDGKGLERMGGEGSGMERSGMERFLLIMY